VAGVDVSSWQAPGSVHFAAVDFAIIRTSHGLTEDTGWRAHFNAVVAAGKPLGLYHFAETTSSPEAQADYFHGLAGFLSAAQVHMGWWLDVEQGQDGSWVDRFRSRVALPTIGLYSNLAGFNGGLAPYQHFMLNWLAMPAGVVVPAGWRIPDHILVQTGQFAGVDVDVVEPAQPYPGAWA